MRWCSNNGNKSWILKVGCYARICYHEKLTEKLQQHATMIQILQQQGYQVHVLPILLGNTLEIVHGTLANIKYVVSAEADVGMVAR